MSSPTPPETIDPKELFKLRLDYAWKYFDSAARHRMLFFNFFLLATGILANALVLALKEHFYVLAIYVCAFGFLTALAFMVMDHRMLVFVNRSLAVLDKLERETLFPDSYISYAPEGKKGIQLGLARVEPRADDGRGFVARSCHYLTKVKWWIRIVIQGTAAVGFLCGIALSLCLRNVHDQAASASPATATVVPVSPQPTVNQDVPTKHPDPQKQTP